MICLLVLQLLLLHYKAQVNLQDNEGNTPLHLATANGHAEVRSSLLIIHTNHEFHETCHYVTFIVVVNSHQR